MNLTEYVRNKQIKEKRKLFENEIRIITKQILEGLEYLNNNGYIHRDIKPENFVINEKTLEVKMIDFGTVKNIRETKPPYTSYVSTRWYRSPETVLRSNHYSYASDIFAVGCIMGELFNGNPLFTGTSEMDQLDAIFKLLGTPS